MRMSVRNTITGRASDLQRVATSLVVAVGVVSYLVMGATAASASCGRQPTIEESMARAELVFVGTAVEVTNSSRWATFAVEDIWKGQVDGDRAEVRGGSGRENVSSSVDRRYLLNTRYLVFAVAPPSGPPLVSGFCGEGVRWTDNSCSFTQPYTASLREARPATAHAVGPPPQEPSIERPDATAPQSAGSPADRGPFDPSWPFALAVAAAGGAGAVGIGIRRHQHASARR